MRLNIAAKIALGFTVAEYGKEIINNSYLAPSILGDLDDVGKWVGQAGEFIGPSELFYDVKIGIKDSQIYVWIILFSKNIGSIPIYLVVVGPAPNNWESKRISTVIE